MVTRQVWCGLCLTDSDRKTHPFRGEDAQRSSVFFNGHAHLCQDGLPGRETHASEERETSCLPRAARGAEALPLQTDGFSLPQLLLPGLVELGDDLLRFLPQSQGGQALRTPASAPRDIGRRARELDYQQALSCLLFADGLHRLRLLAVLTVHTHAGSRRWFKSRCGTSRSSSWSELESHMQHSC